MIENVFQLKFLQELKEIIIWGIFIIVGIVLASLNYYTGSVKKLDLMIEDLNKFGFITQNTLLYDKFWNNNTNGYFDISFISHMFYVIPSEKNYPNLYQNAVCLKKLKTVQRYRNFYKLFLMFFFIIIVIALLFIRFL